MATNKTKPEASEGHQRITVKLAGLLAFTTFVFAILVAAVVACLVGLRDPDICWILAMGRFITSHNALPFIDPFSSNLSTYAIVGRNLPLMQYQWLVEILFFKIWAQAGLQGILATTGLVACTALLALPMTYLVRGRVPMLLSLIVLILGFSASYLRIFARPEIFSMLYMAILVAANLHYGLKSQKQMYVCAALSFLVMALWSNTHMLFPLGLGFLALHGLVVIAESLIKEKKWPTYLPLLAFTICSSSLATCINPWGHRIWYYIWRLAISPVSYDNIDHQAPDLASPAAIALIILGICYYLWFAYSIKSGRNRCSDLLPLAFLVVATVFAVKHAKLVPIAVILACAGLSELNVRSRSVQNAADNFIAQVNRFLDELWKPMPFYGASLILLITIVGAFLSSGVRTPQLPEDTAVIKPPLKAIAFLREHPQKGRLLNEGLYGSCMTWYINPPIDIFMDSRFSMFEPALVAQYKEMMLCQNNWRQLMQDYKIAYVFAPVFMPITQTLAKDPEWKTIYRDQDAMVLVKL
ncbi:MAG: hypothetical protein P4L53_06085 [Candidatus Obscuribacterales bacterium]|nr:hypothetical protein [Candidatus Obscuribacterales bacterium]